MHGQPCIINSLSLIGGIKTASLTHNIKLSGQPDGTFIQSLINCLRESVIYAITFLTDDFNWVTIYDDRIFIKTDKIMSYEYGIKCDDITIDADKYTIKVDWQSGYVVFSINELSSIDLHR